VADAAFIGKSAACAGRDTGVVGLTWPGAGEAAGTRAGRTCGDVAAWLFAPAVAGSVRGGIVAGRASRSHSVVPGLLARVQAVPSACGKAAPPRQNFDIAALARGACRGARRRPGLRATRIDT